MNGPTGKAGRRDRIHHNALRLVSSNWVTRLFGYQVAGYQDIRITGKNKFILIIWYPDPGAPGQLGNLIS